MKTLPKAFATLALVLCGTLVSTAAMADYRGHGHRGHGGHGGGMRFGISLGVPLFGPRYYPAPYYPYPGTVYAYPPVVVAPAAPPVYIEQAPAAQAPAPSQAQANWYYCAAANAYYPYVAQCPAGWQAVPAQPASN